MLKSLSIHKQPCDATLALCHVCPSPHYFFPPDFLTLLGEIWCLPFALRAANTLRPFFVLRRARKPDTRFDFLQAAH